MFPLSLPGVEAISMTHLVGLNQMPKDEAQGSLVFRLELPLELAPVLNRYSTMSVKKRCSIRRNIDSLVMKAKKNWPAWHMGVKRITKGKIAKGKLRTCTEVSGGRKRTAVVTRYSSRCPDELSVDIIGGKMAIDRLVTADVLRDDSTTWLTRYANWRSAPPKAGKLVVEIFEQI
jgi:hypothetical protein